MNFDSGLDAALSEYHQKVPGFSAAQHLSFAWIELPGIFAGSSFVPFLLRFLLCR